MVDNPVAHCLVASGLDARRRSEDDCGWQRAWDALGYQPAAHAAIALNYQHAYFRDAGWAVTDISMVLLNDGRPCGLWPLALGGPPGDTRLFSAGGPVLAPLFVAGLSPRTVKKLCACALEFLRLLCSRLGLKSLLLRPSVDPTTTAAGLGEWHQQLMAAGALPTLRHELFTHLQPPLPDIRATFRKSFRPLINVGLRNWTVFVMQQPQADVDVWREFQQLHQLVAGRSTRGDDTWAAQFAMVGADQAFLAGLRDPASNRLVGAGFFQCTRDEAEYAVGAYDRSLFDKPLGHVVQQVAIETMKARGLRWYRIGECQYSQDQPPPSEKQVSIAAFKQGFASHLFGRTELHWVPTSHPGCGAS